jgi:hypothetical protein
MKISFQKIKLYAHLLIIFLVVIVFAVAFVFLREYFYQTMAQSEDIILLQRNVPPNVVDVEKTNEALKKMREKKEQAQSPETVKTIKNVFK